MIQADEGTMQDIQTLVRKGLRGVSSAEEFDTFVSGLFGAGERQCVGCDLCCVAMDVRDGDLQKDMNVRCQHLGECGGCKVYASRPELCRQFYCSWRMSEVFDWGIPDALKPSECGFVLHWDRMRAPLLMTLFKDPARPNAWARHKRSLETIARKFDVAIAVGGGREATHVVTPMGTWFARADHPELFQVDGLSVGVPRGEYRRSL